MPELPDIRLYVCRLSERVVGTTLDSIAFGSPFILRSVAPPASQLLGKRVLGVSRLGKRLVFELEQDLFLMIHLMIAGRLQWVSPMPALKRPSGKAQLAIFRFSNVDSGGGQLTLVENSTKKRASVTLVEGRDQLEKHRREGIDPTTCTSAAFQAQLASDRRSLKRALTDPSWFDGIGNAYSDEILFHARLSPARLTTSLTSEEAIRLAESAKRVLEDWTVNLEKLFPGFPRPADITAFRPEFHVHGKFGQPCDICGAAIQHIVYADKETNYCAVCQNEGRLLADRSLSRLLKEDWPKMLRIED